jgi:hypothetical protein
MRKGIWAVTKLRMHSFMRQLVTNKVLVPPKGKRKNHLTMYLFSLELSALCTLYLCNVSVARKEEKVSYVLESSEKDTGKNVCCNKNYVLPTCLSLLGVFQDRGQWLC